MDELAADLSDAEACAVADELPVAEGDRWMLAWARLVRRLHDRAVTTTYHEPFLAAFIPHQEVLFVREGRAHYDGWRDP